MQWMYSNYLKEKVIQIKSESSPYVYVSLAQDLTVVSTTLYQLS